MQIIRLGQVKLFGSPALFLAYEDVLKRPSQLATSDILASDLDAILNELAGSIEPVTAPPVLSAASFLPFGVRHAACNTRSYTCGAGAATLALLPISPSSRAVNMTSMPSSMARADTVLVPMHLDPPAQKGEYTHWSDCPKISGVLLSILEQALY
jgi:hypothetical protein